MTVNFYSTENGSHFIVNVGNRRFVLPPIYSVLSKDDYLIIRPKKSGVKLVNILPEAIHYSQVVVNDEFYEDVADCVSALYFISTDGCCSGNSGALGSARGIEEHNTSSEAHEDIRELIGDIKEQNLIKEQELVDIFSTSTGHNHDGENSRRVDYNDLEHLPCLKDYIREVPKPGTVMHIKGIADGRCEPLIAEASNGKTYFCCNYSGIKVLNNDTGELENTNISTGEYAGACIASNGKTYFLGWGAGIKVLNDVTGAIENTNIGTGYYRSAIIASNGKTYFYDGGDTGVLNDFTGEIESIVLGIIHEVIIASDGKTYFCGTSIKVLNDVTGAIVATNISNDIRTFYSAIIASDGKTYFLGGRGIYVLNDITGIISGSLVGSTVEVRRAIIASDGKTYFLCTNLGIRVLNDVTGEIENTNVGTGQYVSAIIASDGKTYFYGFNNPIMVLNDITGELENTNVDNRSIIGAIIASDGRTYFYYDGIMVLDDDTGELENTNTSGKYYQDAIIASDGKTYFVGTAVLGLKVLDALTEGLEWIRKYGAWDLIKKFNYTTEEQNTGEQWFGKTIYQKTFNLGNAHSNSSGSTVVSSFNIGALNNVDILVGCEISGFSISGASGVFSGSSIAFYETVSGELRLKHEFHCELRDNALRLCYSTSSSIYISGGYITVRYTKNE